MRLFTTTSRMTDLQLQIALKSFGLAAGVSSLNNITALMESKCVY